MKKVLLAGFTAALMLVSDLSMARNKPGFGSFEVAYGNTVWGIEDSQALDLESGFVALRADYNLNKYLAVTGSVGTTVEPFFSIDNARDDNLVDFGDFMQYNLALKINAINTKKYSLYAKGGYQYNTFEDDDTMQGFSYGAGLTYKFRKGMSVGAEFTMEDLEYETEGGTKLDIDGYTALAFLRFDGK